MFNALLPKGAPFFELLLQQNGILCAVTDTLTRLLECQDETECLHAEIARLEEEADALHMAVIKHLSQTFITPIDREDILHINMETEECIDLIQNLTNRLYIFEFERIRFPMRQLGRTVAGMALVSKDMLQGLSKRCDSHKTKAFRMLQHEGEMLFSTGLGELYDHQAAGNESMLGILKWSQSYDRMEQVFRQLIKLAESIEEAVLKNA